MSGMEDIWLPQVASDIFSLSQYRVLPDVGPSDLAQAYTYQDKLVAKLIEMRAPNKVAGYKFAANSEKLMQHYQITDPISARIFDSQVHETGTKFQADHFSDFTCELRFVSSLAHR